MTNHTVYLVGELQEDGSIDGIKSFGGLAWAKKYAAKLGDKAVYSAQYNVEFSLTPFEAQPVPTA